MIYKKQISIHAPPRGATTEKQEYPLAQLFQFTPLREGRRNMGNWCKPIYSISIHAPPRGATKPEPPHCGGSPISIHAPPRGATT